MKLPIRARLTAWYGLFLGAALIMIGAFLVLKLRSDLRSTIDREVRASSSAIRQSYTQEGPRGFAETSSAALRRSGSDAQVLDARGGVVAAYGADLAQDPMLSAARRQRALAREVTLLDVKLGDAAQPYRVMAVRVLRAGSPQLVLVAESLQEVNEAVREILLLLVIVGPIALVAAGIGGWVLVRNSLRPVDRMRKKAEQIGIDHLHQRLATPNPVDEIGQLAATLNAMLDRLEEGVTARRRLVADASHELRTPLAAMRAELDVALRDAQRTPLERQTLRSVREDVDRMSHTVDNLLTLALADEGRLELRRQAVELDELARSVATPLQALAAAKGVRLVVMGEPAATEGDAQRLRQALTNLVENAIKFTPADGTVTVTSWRDGVEVGVTVQDDGPGIAPAQRGHVFDRFFRADPSRSRESGGSGLGLAICYEIAVAHGGRTWVQSDEGRGSAFSIALPAAVVPERPRVPAGETGPGQRPGR